MRLESEVFLCPIPSVSIKLLVFRNYFQGNIPSYAGKKMIDNPLNNLCIIQGVEKQHYEISDESAGDRRVS